MTSNAGKRLDTHKKYLKISRKGISKALEPLYVYFLRGSEKVCKVFDTDITASAMGVSSIEVANITQDDYDKLYKVLFSYFTLILSGENLPETYEYRIQTTKNLVGGEYQTYLLDKVGEIYGNKKGIELWLALSAETTILIQDILRLNNLKLEEFKTFIMGVAVKDIGVNAANRKSKSGCYIATEIYGNYDSSEVIVLRNYRDLILHNSALGRTFIRIYYKLSPLIVKTNLLKYWFRRPIRFILNSIVNFLKTNYPQL